MSKILWVCTGWGKSAIWGAISRVRLAPRAIATGFFHRSSFLRSDRTIKNDATFTVALDTLTSAMGEEPKHSILTRISGLTKKEILSLARVIRDEGKEIAQKLLENKRIQALTGSNSPKNLGFSVRTI